MLINQVLCGSGPSHWLILRLQLLKLMALAYHMLKVYKYLGIIFDDHDQLQ